MISPEYADEFIRNESRSQVKSLARQLRDATTSERREELRQRLLCEIGVALAFCPETVLEPLLRTDGES